MSKSIGASRAIRQLHVVSTATGASSSSTIQGIIPQHSQNRYVAAVIHDSSPSTNVKSAQDIQHLLTNIGADTRASNKMIERLMHKTASSKDSQHVTAGDLIDLIARVRSV